MDLNTGSPFITEWSYTIILSCSIKQLGIITFILQNYCGRKKKVLYLKSYQNCGPITDTNKSMLLLLLLLLLFLCFTSISKSLQVHNSVCEYKRKGEERQRERPTSVSISSEETLFLQKLEEVIKLRKIASPLPWDDRDNAFGSSSFCIFRAFIGIHT